MVGRQQAGEHFERGGFSRAVEPEEADDLAGGNCEAERAHRLLGTEAFGKFVQGDHLFQFAFKMKLIRWPFGPLASWLTRCRSLQICASFTPRQSPKILRALVSSGKLIGIRGTLLFGVGDRITQMIRKGRVETLAVILKGSAAFWRQA